MTMLNHYLPALPQVARALVFAQHAEPAVLLVHPERLAVYSALGGIKQGLYINPDMLAMGQAHNCLLTSDQALEPFPQQPQDWHLVLQLGQNYPREALLNQLTRMGYWRSEDLMVRGDTLELDIGLRLEFFGDTLDTIKLEGKPLDRHVLFAKAGKSEEWTSHKIVHTTGTVFIDTPSLMPAQLWPLLEGRDVVVFGMGTPLELPTLDIGYRALPPYRARVSQAVDDIAQWLADGYAVMWYYRHPKSRAYVRSKIEQSGHTIAVAPDGMQPIAGKIRFCAAGFEGAYIDHHNKQVHLTEHHLYAFGGTDAIRHSRVIAKTADAEGLATGDYLIHPEHGIGQYMGLETREVLGVKRDYLSLRYAKEGRMYLPVEQLPLLRRHPGTTDDPPTLSTLGKGEWKKTRDKASKDAEEMAQKLLILHAKRDSMQGRQFESVQDWDSLIEKNFPFELTPDQVTALADVMMDLEAAKPMERLVSGDVGFGKTEVALRGAHRVVGHGAQVAVLVPTTLLAEQHGQTFAKRFEGLPVNVAVLSRFSTDKEVKKLLEGVKKGSIDIVIGTHRLLSSEVVFKDLGLLIIDEEHRFGVGQKERIRELADKVDTLFLSATPIPRTLYSALVGLRDMSSIQTPPAGRKAIDTYTLPFNPVMVRQAIMDELERGGKAFYVHDRVASMLGRRSYLEALVPEARFGVVHGQMSESDIDAAMTAFEEGAFDVLMATTIIETGLDIQGANTMIVERADKLGLAALYQLRGRVGRRQERACAYLFHPLKLTEAAERRLSAIGDLSDLGAGHLLAEKDMEIRGVGNLLGAEQHGHIRAVSLEIYTELLADAIRKLKGQTMSSKPNLSLDLQVSARLTPEYIPSAAARSRLYGKFATVEKLAHLSRLVKDTLERYGQPPEEVANFMTLAKLRLVATSRGVVALKEDMINVQLEFANWPVDYNVKAFREFISPLEVTQYPPGFKLRKNNAYNQNPLAVIEQLLYLLD